MTCNMQQVTNCYTHLHTYSKIETCLRSLSVKQWSSLVMIFFMNVEISFPVICYNGKIYVLMSNLVALHQELILVITWTLPQDVFKGCQVGWLQTVLDCLHVILCCMPLMKQRHCSSQNTCPVWHRVISNQGHETAYCVRKCTSEEAVVMY